MKATESTDERKVTRALLEFLRDTDYRPLAQADLLHRMNVPADRRPLVRRLIAELLEEGRIVQTTRGRLTAAPRRNVVQGRLHRHREGYGFVVPEDGSEDVFIAARDLAHEITGDTVEARITRRGRAGRMQGVIVRTVERRHRRIIGVYVEFEGRGRVQAFDPGLGNTIVVPASFLMGARHEDVVEVEIVGGREGSATLEGKVLEILGSLEDPGTIVAVVSRRYGLPLEVPESVLAAGEALPRRIRASDKRGRVRFDDPPPVTIDGETARDFDDAIAVVPRAGGGFELYVHIADVSHFVRPGDLLDREARKRGTSVYFPGTVLPMLPPRISDDLCSLRPGVDRLVQTAILQIDAAGRTVDVRFEDGVIRSAARLTYTQVAEFLAGGKDVPGIPDPVAPMLRHADDLRRVLSRRRKERGGIDVDLPEPQLLLDVEGEVTGVRIEPRNAAHLMIEEFMIAANEAVASWLERRERPCMFRVHDAPDPAKLELLAGFAASMGQEMPESVDRIDGPALGRLLDRLEGSPEQAVLSQMLLRSMQQARYTMSNSGHFGLGAPSYCHFTSPIRRYPDLIIHRLVRAARGGAVFPTEDEPDLEETAGQLCSLERNAEGAEREVLAWKKLALVSGREGEEFDGVVTGIAKFGMFIQLTENLVEGLVRVERMGGDRFDFDESRQELRGRATGSCFRLGERLRVRLERVDRILRRVDFELLGVSRPKPEANRGRRRTGEGPRRGRRERAGAKAKASGRRGGRRPRS